MREVDEVGVSEPGERRVGPGVEEQHVERGEPEVEERSRLEPRVAEPPGDHHEERRLGGPHGGEAAPREQARKADRHDRQGYGAEHRRQLAEPSHERGGHGRPGVYGAGH
jgi:hypothetical protein